MHAEVCVCVCCESVYIYICAHRGCVSTYAETDIPTHKQMCFYFQLSGDKVEDVPGELQSLQGTTHQSPRFTEPGTIL